VVQLFFRLGGDGVLVANQREATWVLFGMVAEQRLTTGPMGPLYMRMQRKLYSWFQGMQNETNITHINVYKNEGICGMALPSVVNEKFLRENCDLNWGRCLSSTERNQIKEKDIYKSVQYSSQIYEGISIAHI